MKSARERSFDLLAQALRRVGKRRPFPPRTAGHDGVPVDRTPPSTLDGGAAAVLAFDD